MKSYKKYLLARDSLVISALFVFLIGLPIPVKADVWSSTAPKNDNALCVYNSNSAISKQVCDYYASKRAGSKKLGLNIPDKAFSGVLDLVSSDKFKKYSGEFIDYLNTSKETMRENMTDDDFAAYVAQPIADFMDSGNGSITHIAVAKDIPIRIHSKTLVDDLYPRSISGAYFLSFDSDKDTRIGDIVPTVDDYGMISKCTLQDAHFNRNKCTIKASGYKIRYAVSYLTGFDLADIEKMVDKAQAPEPDLASAKWFIDYGSGKGGLSSGLDHDIPAVKNSLITLGIDQDDIVVERTDTTPLKAVEPIAAYGGLGVHQDDAGYGGRTWLSSNDSVQMPVANRAVIDVYESFFGATAASAYSVGSANIWGQGLLAQAFQPRVFGGTDYSNSFSGGVGTVSEPGTAGVVNFNTFFSAYASGKTLAESFLTDLTGHQRAMAIGDPLMTITDSKMISPLAAPDLEIYGTSGTMDADGVLSLDLGVSASQPASVSTPSLLMKITSGLSGTLDSVRRVFSNPDSGYQAHAIIDWGDGSQAENIILPLKSDRNAKYNLNATHSYRSSGRFSVKMRVVDPYGREYGNYTYPVTVPAIKILEPSADKNISNGDGYAISWTTTDSVPKNALMTIFLIGPTLNLNAFISKEGVPNTGSYIWNIPQDQKTGRYQIQIACKSCRKDIAYATSPLFNITENKLVPDPAASDMAAPPVATPGASMRPNPSPSPTPLATVTPAAVNTAEQTTSLSVTNDAATQSADIYPGLPDQILGRFIVTIKGNPVIVYGLTMHAMNTSQDISGTKREFMTGVVLVDERGNIVDGPVTVGDNGTTNIIFRHNIVFAPGSHTYTVKGRLNPALWIGPTVFHLSTAPGNNYWRTEKDETSGYMNIIASGWAYPTDQVTGRPAVILTPGVIMTTMVIRSLPTPVATPILTPSYSPTPSSSPASTPAPTATITPNMTVAPRPSSSPVTTGNSRSQTGSIFDAFFQILGGLFGNR
jgi:hypothetical protein